MVPPPGFITQYDALCVLHSIFLIKKPPLWNHIFKPLQLLIKTRPVTSSKTMNSGVLVFMFRSLLIKILIFSKQTCWRRICHYHNKITKPKSRTTIYGEYMNKSNHFQTNVSLQNETNEKSTYWGMHQMTRPFRKNMRWHHFLCVSDEKQCHHTTHMHSKFLPRHSHINGIVNRKKLQANLEKINTSLIKMWEWMCVEA